MAKKKSKTSVSINSLFAILIVLVGLALTIVGVCITWANYNVTSIIGDSTTALLLSDLTDGDGYGLMAAFAYITLGVSALCLLVAVAREFVSGIPSIVQGVSALAALVCAVVLFVVTIIFCNSNAELAIGSIVNGSLAIGIGAILAPVGGVLASAGTFLHGKYAK